MLGTKQLQHHQPFSSFPKLASPTHRAERLPAGDDVGVSCHAPATALQPCNHPMLAGGYLLCAIAGGNVGKTITACAAV